MHRQREMVCLHDIEYLSRPICADGDAAAMAKTLIDNPVGTVGPQCLAETLAGGIVIGRKGRRVAAVAHIMIIALQPGGVTPVLPPFVGNTARPAFAPQMMCHF